VAEPMIGIAGIRKSFRRPGLKGFLRPTSAQTKEVLTGVDLEVQRGDYVALLGANGAGKTTVLKSVATLLLPDAGTVSVLGMDVAKHQRAVRDVTGYVLADERSFHWRLSAAENLDFFAQLDGITAERRAERITFLLDRLDLTSATGRPFGEFSTGMKQRLAVARALLKGPRVLLMDEPTRSIDPAHAADVWRLVREEVERVNGCLVLVTHQIQEALSLCTRVAILAEGRIVLDTTANALEKIATDLDGFTVSVRGLPRTGLEHLRGVQGVRDVRVASQVAGEQILEVSTAKGAELPLGGFIQELTGLGATLCSLQRATPLQTVVERLLAPPAQMRTAV
jgi:ABC-2 type transport system ATP-binding protein